MRRTRGFRWLPLLVVATTAADGRSWDAKLAEAFSGRLEEVGVALEEVQAEFPGLPTLPIDDQGGTGGAASLHREAEVSHSFTIRWEVPASVDRVVLVPPRRYDVDGLEPQYGTPDEFEVALLDAEGGVLETVAEVGDVWAHPARAGHPFSWDVEPAEEAAGLRITARRLFADTGDEDTYVHAWAEAFVFEETRNVARGAEVTSSGGSSPTAPWHWSEEFLVDEQTPLGLPEVPAPEHKDIGWLSRGRESAEESMWLDVDLGEVRAFDAVRLFPAKKPTADLPSGFGFPKELRIAVSETPLSRAEADAAASLAMRNPGHNPVRVPVGEQRGRYVRVEAERLWKAYDGFPAFFALSEIEVLDGAENVARGAAIRTADGMGNVIATGARYWNAVSLCDGHGPDGRLVPTREWLGLLDRRLELETRRHRLREERREIIGGWRRLGISSVALLGGAGAFALIVLPIRYRTRERRELRKVRERIASDLHDEVGSNLGSIQMFADLAEGRAGPSDELKRIQRIAAETVSAVRDIVWLLRPKGGHRIGTVEHLRETASIMLEPLEWQFHADEGAWQVELSDESSRHLFLYFREALHNILRHAGATKVEVEVSRTDPFFLLRVRDDGKGIPGEKLGRSSTLRALRQRAEALEAGFDIRSTPGEGTELELRVPMT